jgi:hypothetical protein
MGDTARPVEGRPDQTEQAQLIRRTANGPTVDNEAELLAELYGPPDMAGVYSGPGLAADGNQDDNQGGAAAADGGETA